MKKLFSFLLTIVCGLIWSGCQAQPNVSVNSFSQQSSSGAVPAIPYSKGPTSPPDSLKGPKTAPPGVSGFNAKTQSVQKSQ